MPLESPTTTPQLWFYIVMGLALVSWVALFIAPQKRAINWWLCGVVTPSILAVVYAYFLVAYWSDLPHKSFVMTYADRFGSLQGVSQMFSTNEHGLLLVGWLDILAMDLVGGAWQARRAQRTGMRYILLLPCLLVTYAQAPLGLGLYFIVEAVRGKLRATDLHPAPGETAATV